MSDIKNLRPSDYPYPQLQEVPSEDCSAMPCSAWISILKEMPDDWATVNLYSHQTEEVFSGYYSPEDDGENSFVAHHVNYGFSLETVTHWCPLPDPPAKEKCRNWMIQNLQSWPRKCPTCEHVADASKKVDDACEIGYHAHLEKGNVYRWTRLDCYRAAWQDALAWKGGASE